MQIVTSIGLALFSCGSCGKLSGLPTLVHTAAGANAGLNADTLPTKATSGVAPPRLRAVKLGIILIGGADQARFPREFWGPERLPGEWRGRVNTLRPTRVPRGFFHTG